ncbi:hypothetical protein ABZ738_05455 [Micromonospora sp. NPDC047793]|uniref:hypothetical protein n=1 Tax=Micromonospora sp. NPDC047793 TaxID=3154342 RepID=UPI0033C1FB83
MATVDYTPRAVQRGWPVRFQVWVDGVWHTRVTGVIFHLAPRLIEDGVDADGVNPYVVDVHASGPMHRLLKGAHLPSPLSIALGGSTVLAAWLSLEDSVTARNPAVGITGQPRATGVNVQFGQVDRGLPGASSVARLEQPTSRIIMPVSAGDQIGVGSDQACSASWYWTSIEPLSATPVDIARITLQSDLIATVVVRANEAGLNTVAFDAAGTDLGDVFAFWPTAGDPTEGDWLGIRVEIERPGLIAPVRLRTSVHGVGELSWIPYSTTVSGTMGLGGISQVEALGGAFSHMSVVNTLDTPPSTQWPAAGHAREYAQSRLTRVTEAAGVPMAPVTPPTTTVVRMGPSPQSGLLDVLRDVEQADVGGVLYEDRLGRMAWLGRVDRYNQEPSMTLSYGQLAPPLEASDDDRFTRNAALVTADGIDPAYYEDAAHIARFGRYDDEVEFNVTDLRTLSRRAQWLVHMGTVEDMRYPVVTLLLHAPETEPLLPQWLACDIGSRVVVTGVPEPLGGGAMDQSIAGYTEVLTTHAWVVTASMAPASPWRVFVLGDPERGRLDTAGSELALAAGSSDTTLLVATDPGRRRWMTSAERPADFPLHVNVGAEVVQVDDIAGTSSPQTFSVTRAVSGLGIEHPAGTRVRVARWGV